MSSIIPISTGDSTIPDHISKLRSAARDIQELETMLLAREKELQRNAGDLEKKLEKVESEKLKLEEEVKQWKNKCGMYEEKLTRVEDDRDILLESEKMIGDRYNKLLAVSEKAIMKKNQELNQLKEKLGEAEDSAKLWQTKYQRYKCRVERTIQTTTLCEEPTFVNEAEEVVGQGGLESADITVPSGDRLKDIAEIDHYRDDSMLATRKRLLDRNVNNIDDDVLLQNRKRMKNLSSPDMSQTSNPLAFGQSKGKKFVSEAEMRCAINEDNELCMSAVCAIYRQQRNHRSSGPPYPLSGFSPSDSISGRSLALFLTDGDPQGKRQKSVTELHDHDPEGINECRRLASNHVKQLFRIYQKKEDPYFCPATIRRQAHW